MALHNYIYLKHKTSDQECHRLMSREHDNRPNVEYVRNKNRGGTKKSDNEGGGPSDTVTATATNVSPSIITTSTPDRTG
ncbi:uncharacterized protein KLLA0_B04466g [Kluyveromyces lactis]|uniref:KLLA0B04466p n=1 Tax=Kluyveromyces lactis (strain ATCC 8585 / CBS 2359 / DSM 70799 / NBRC 1267 / NRRL Y-1140 / WM37) TaxID=284590 RepID=B5RSJ1_KLULA|nr:uncharacterized protein KLLA0_B04466g [Kluyveromyces lactis]CAR65225.1 KLLA0B04466p [Kluyveromyces lactis]|eukprot:XP_002999354.1 uncharacterized protein KLLA0_B04466g [Kluyveromyces lactis]